MLNKILVVLLILLAFVGGFAVAVSLLPDEFVVTRSKIVNAPPSEIFELVSDFNRSNSWSPWIKDDPSAKTDIEGGEPKGKGKGAKFSWNGNDKMGEGWQEIVEVKPNELVRTELHFKRPWEGHANAKFELKALEGNKTEVIWSMWDKPNFLKKAICLVMKPQKMIEERFDEGLANINKTLTEKKDATK